MTQSQAIVFFVPLISFAAIYATLWALAKRERKRDTSQKHRRAHA